MPKGPVEKSAIITLEDGKVITGTSFGKPVSAAGEVVFNTGMVGYPETLTDPSYRGQILVMTYPLVGNYGVPNRSLDTFGLPAGFESERIQVSGLIVAEHSSHYSHYTSSRSLAEWFNAEGIPAVCDVDTRALTIHLRDKGSMLGRIDFGDTEKQFFDPNAHDLASEVCVAGVTEYTTRGKPLARVVLLDCGSKANIIRSLLMRDIAVIRVPHNHYFVGMDFDGLLISNGPGDPKMYEVATQNVARTLALGKPIFGICLGHQILARAIGADTYKLKFGHRSHNQPCVEHRLTASGNQRRCVITSQNHGYAVRPEGLPTDWRVWFTNANDGTVEGIRHLTKPYSAVQFHPEATPGPNDTAHLFDDFAQQLQQA